MWPGTGVRRSSTVYWARALHRLRQRRVNYDATGQPSHGGGWHVDMLRRIVAREPPGPPQPGGAWECACLLVARYEFAEPRILQAVFRADAGLIGRDMLLHARFYGLRFLVGVRVTTVIDETRGMRRVWGWGYRTLDGHLEQGEMRYEVCKDLESGDVEFVLESYSRRAPIANPFVRVGFRLFGRWTQLRFYRACLARMATQVSAISEGAPVPAPVPLDEGLVLAPSDAVSKRGYRPPER